MIKPVVRKTTVGGVNLRLAEDDFHLLHTATVVEYTGQIRIEKGGNIVFVFDPDEKGNTITVNVDKFDWHAPIVPVVFVKDGSDYYEIVLFEE